MIMALPVGRAFLLFGHCGCKPRKSGGDSMNEYILALDQGTTSSRAIIFNKDGQPVGNAQKK